MKAAALDISRRPVPRRRRAARGVATVLAGAALWLPTATPAAAQESHFAACSNSDLKVVLPGGETKTVPYGGELTFPIPDGVARWICVRSADQFACPPGTTKAKLIRSAARRFEILCLN